MPETLLRSTPDAPWLPAGGRADVVRSDAAPSPTGLVRLLVRRGREVLCVPRDDGRLDLPTRVVPPDDPDGRRTAGELARDVLEGVPRPAPVGFVRNVVTAPAPGYPWPVPLAHFSVWSAAGAPVRAGRWLDVNDEALRERHWWPLAAALQEQGG